MPISPIASYFHPDQLTHRPLYEWAFGAKLDHPETSIRAERILWVISKSPEVFDLRVPVEIPTRWIRAVHDPRLLRLYQTATALEAGTTFYPSVFPKRHQMRANPADLHQAGYFCFDSGTPLTSSTWTAAAWSAACAVSAAQWVQSGAASLAYALSRPPGHHASRDLFGGYCYLNNAATAAEVLRSSGRVALLDIDFHHGNGTQDIFYRDADVYYLSIHGDPREFYPYFSGYDGERGSGAGEGFNLNVPLPAGTSAATYLQALDQYVLPEIAKFAPRWLIVSAGLDTYREDPIGRFCLDNEDFHVLGARLGALGLPTVVVQEGGYFTSALGDNVAAFLTGVRDGQLASMP